MKDRLTSQTPPTSTAKDIYEQLKDNGYSTEQIVTVSNQLIMMAGSEITEGFGPELGTRLSNYDLAQLGMPSD